MSPAGLSRRAFLGATALVLAGCGRDDPEVTEESRADLLPGAPIVPGNAERLDLLGRYRLARAPLLDVAFHPAGSLLLCGADDGGVYALNLKGGVARTVASDRGRVWAVAIGSDAQMYWGGDERVVHTQGGDPAGLVSLRSRVRDLAWNRQGDRLAVADARGEVRVQAAGRWGAPLPVLRNEITGIDWDPRGDRLAVSGTGGESVVYDTRAGRQAARLRHPGGDAGGEMNGITWIGTDALATASQDGGVRIWSARGELLRELPERAGWRRAVRAAPNAPVLADSGEDGLLRLSDAATGRVLTTKRAGRGPVWSVAFSPGGRLLAAASEDGSVRVFGIPLDRS